MRPRKYGESIHIRLDENQSKFIRKLAEELDQTISDTIRDLINIAIMILGSAEMITLKDILFALTSEFEVPEGWKEDVMNEGRRG